MSEMEERICVLEERIHRMRLKVNKLNVALIEARTLAEKYRDEFVYACSVLPVPRPGRDLTVLPWEGEK